MRNKKATHGLMLVLLLIWTVDAVTVSTAVESMSQIFLLCFKTLCSIPVLAVFVHLREGLRLPRKKDVPLLLLATVLGDVLYFFFEYTAYKYLPVAQVTVLLGFLPAASYLVDCCVRRTRPEPRILMVILLSIVGLVLAVWDGQGDGSVIGILSCVLCVIIWIAYGYVARALDRSFSPEAITLYESVGAVALMLIPALLRRPAEIAAGDLWISIIGMGILTTGFGYIIEVRGLIDLGTTVSGIYLNFLPVFTAIAGALVLHQHMTPLQLAGSGLVILCGLHVVRKTA